MYKKYKLFTILICFFLSLSGCGNKDDKSEVEDTKNKVYSLESVHPVNGRQGICTEDGFYYVSGSTTLTKYDKDWNVVAENDNPFDGYDIEVNHIGDIDIYNNELYLGVE